MKVRNHIDRNTIVRGIAAAILAATLAAGTGAVPAALAENAPATVEAPVVADAASAAATTLTAPVATSTAQVATPNVPVAPVATVVRAKKLTVRQIIVKTGRAAGLSTRETDALLWIAKRESNYHPTSISRGGCYGLFQLSKGMARGHAWSDPAWNTKRAIKYMKGRYGGVLQAKAFWLRHHWY